MEELLKPWLALFEDDKKAAQHFGGVRSLFELRGLLRLSMDPMQVAPMAAFLLEELPKVTGHMDNQTRQAAACFAATLHQAWHSDTLFPAQAEDYAEWFRMRLPPSSIPPSPPADPKFDAKLKSRRPPRKITTPPSDEDIGLCAKILLTGGVDGDQTRCGFMPWVAKDYHLIKRAADDVSNDCRGMLGTKKNRVFKNTAKFAEYDQVLKDSSFESEWSAIKRRFPAQTQGKEYFERTLMQERKEMGEAIAKFDTEANRFQAIFDLLCWKYCLWGVEKNKPLLMKPSVNLTPYGTQIFIPAYMSFDPRRDLDLGYIAELHRSRGVVRQGESMSVSRQEKREQAVKMAEADDAARLAGLKGEKRLAKVREAGGLHPLQEDSQVARTIKKGHQIKAAKKVVSSVK